MTGVAAGLILSVIAWAGGIAWGARKPIIIDPDDQWRYIAKTTWRDVQLVGLRSSAMLATKGFRPVRVGLFRREVRSWIHGYEQVLVGRRE